VRSVEAPPPAQFAGEAELVLPLGLDKARRGGADCRLLGCWCRARERVRRGSCRAVDGGERETTGWGLGGNGRDEAMRSGDP
jgi:hypothetical protein